MQKIWRIYIVYGFFTELSQRAVQQCQFVNICRVIIGFEKQVFGMVTAAELFSKFDIIDDAGVILLKKFDEGRNTLEGSMYITSRKRDSLARFIALGFCSSN